MVQWLGHSAHTAKGQGLIPSQETKISQAMYVAVKKKRERERHLVETDKQADNTQDILAANKYFENNRVIVQQQENVTKKASTVDVCFLLLFSH